jgi:hypothetical protein
MSLFDCTIPLIIQALIVKHFITQQENFYKQNFTEIVNPLGISF